VKDFEYLDSVAPSDCAFKAYGATLEGLFANAARAVTGCMVEAESVGKSEEHEIELKAKSLSDLLYSLLEEIIYLKDSEGVFLVDFELDISISEEYLLKAKASGEKIDYKKQEIYADVKAVTMHRFDLRETADGWEAFVVLDL